MGKIRTCAHALTVIFMNVSTNNKKDKLAGQLFRALPYILAAVLWILLITCGQYYLRKVEDLSVFMFDWMYFREAIAIPGGFLGVAGSFFTQFLHLPWLGSLMWIFILLCVYQLTVRAFCIPRSLMSLAIIPAVLLIIGNMSLGYGVFIMREQDHFFAPALGYLASLVPLFSIRRIKTVWGKLLLLLAWTAAGYPLLGVFALTGTLTAACSVLTDSDSLRNEKITTVAVAVTLILLIPLVEYNFFTSYRLADSWRLGLPTASEEVWNRSIRTPLQLALLFMPVMALLSHRLKEGRRDRLIQATVFAVSAISVWGFWFKDSNFRTELAMSLAVDRSDWQEVVDIFRKESDSHVKSDEKAYKARSAKLEGVKDRNERRIITDRFSNRFFEPTRTMVLYRDLALLKMNRALDEAFTMKDGGRPQKSRTQIPMALQSGKQLYTQYGLVNMSYRWCMEDIIEHNWSYSTLKYMAMHSVIMHETSFAQRYLNKLKKTIFYRRWAIEQEPLAHDSLKMSSAEPYRNILPYMCFDDRMTNDMVKSETFLMRHYNEEEPPHATPEYDRAALFWAMRIQNIPLFWNRLYLYVRSNQVEKLPRSVEEAAFLYHNLDKSGFDLPYTKEVQDSYDAFNRFVKTNPVVELKESAYPYSRKFGKSFYYFYYFIRNIQTY